MTYSSCLLEQASEGNAHIRASFDKDEHLRRIDVILFTRFGLTVKQATDCHYILDETLFSTEHWRSKNRAACTQGLNDALDAIVQQHRITVLLDDWLDSKDCPKG